ncbi:hypothetical protein [Actinopolymorpha sp. B9G3]|uniref:hypothetical protein n=1 Tax=Actinopolymorpha sp. B9G3 TaxID=3158970 RepID=UPI0032D8EA67
MSTAGRGDRGRPASPLTRPPSVVELGTLEQPDRGNPSFIRDGGMSGPVGGKLLWLFGDAISPHFGLVDNSAALGPSLPVSAAADLTRTDEQTDADGNPVPFIPMTAAEQNPPEGDRFALWAGNRIVPTADGSGDAWVFFHQLQIPWDFDSHPWWTSAGIARIHAPDARHRYPYVTRDNPVACNPTCLFTAQVDPHQFNGTAIVDDGYLYLTHAGSNPPYGRPLFATRADFSALDRLLTEGDGPGDTETAAQIKALFRYWNGGPGADPASWVDDMTQAASMVGFEEAWGGHHSISWNAYLSSYIAVYLDWDRKLKIRTAPTYVGPWSAPMELYDTASACTDNGTLNLYSGWDHPDLATANGRSIVVSYYCGNSVGSSVPAQVHLLRATFPEPHRLSKNKEK